MEVIIQNIEAEILDASGIDKAYIVSKYKITFFVYNASAKLSGEIDWRGEIDIPEIKKRILQFFDGHEIHVTEGDITHKFK